MDKRVERLAELIIGWCTGVKGGDKVYLVTNEITARPLYETVRRKVIERGATPFDNFVYGGWCETYLTDRDWLRYASEEQLNYLPPIKSAEMEAMDVVIVIEAKPDHLKPQVSERRLSRWSKTIDPLAEERLRKRYVDTFFPTADYARETGISLRELRGIYYSACFQDREKLASYLNQVKQVFEGAKQVHILGKDTDLTFSLKGRPGCIENGKENLPGGEVYFAPVEDSLEGEIAFSYPGVYFGQRIEGIQLVFRGGKVVSARAETNPKTLNAILNTDRRSRFVGEFGIGCNPAVKRFTGELYLDEVIIGTIHLALGDAYPECKGANESSVHFDIVKDLREGGEIWIDDRLINKDGIWIPIERPI